MILATGWKSHQRPKGLGSRSCARKNPPNGNNWSEEDRGVRAHYLKLRETKEEVRGGETSRKPTRLLPRSADSEEKLQKSPEIRHFFSIAR